MDSQTLSEEERIQDYYDRATILNLNFSNEKTQADIEREKKNEANREYYASNKAKILGDRKKSKTEKNKKKCEERGLPYYLADYIAFREGGKIVLTFADITELTKTLHWIKFKSQFGEEILKIEKK